MPKIANDITELIGKTPIVKINKLTTQNDATIYAKLESFNPGGSIKDRIALNMIIDAEKKGFIKKGDTIIEPTSGNTGIGLAMIAAQRGYNLVLVMPESVSQERKSLLKAYGAELILVKPEQGAGMNGAVSVAEEIAKEKGWFMLQQFNNPANPETHMKTTGPEIYKAFKKKSLDYLVAGVGTGGTITGTGKYLKMKFKELKIIAVEPAYSAVLSGEKACPHKIQGIGAGFIPKILDTTIYDTIVKVRDEDAKYMAQQLAKQEGILAGISSGAAMYAAVEIGKNKKEKNVLVILPDTGERYLSTGLFDNT